MSDKLHKLNVILTSRSPSYDLVYDLMKESGHELTIREYINSCKKNSLIPDIEQEYIKIAEGDTTLEELNAILEDVVDSVEERIKRKTRVNPTSKHITHGGKQRLGGARMAGRVNPKKSRSSNTQKHGSSSHAHDRSTKTQRKNAD
jgi:hypothetical protein